MSRFLQRWSERKAEARKAEPEDLPALEPLPPAEAPPEALPDLDAEALAEKLAALPPLEDITSATDIRPFLQDFVPRALKNAAMRRAWSADPVISTHLDVARDYAWEFNAGPLPVGFSAELPGEVVERALEAMEIAAPPVDPAQAAISDDSAAEISAAIQNSDEVITFSDDLSTIPPEPATNASENPPQPAERPKKFQLSQKNGGALPD